MATHRRLNRRGVVAKLHWNKMPNTNEKPSDCEPFPMKISNDWRTNTSNKNTMPTANRVVGHGPWTRPKTKQHEKHQPSMTTTKRGNCRRTNGVANITLPFGVMAIRRPRPTFRLRFGNFDTHPLPNVFNKPLCRLAFRIPRPFNPKPGPLPCNTRT